MGNPYKIPRNDVSYSVKFYGEVVMGPDGQKEWVGGENIMVVAYDVPTLEYKTKTTINLWLWSTIVAPEYFDLDAFNFEDHPKAYEALKRLTEKDVVSSVATVLVDLYDPVEWMPMEKLHAEYLVLKNIYAAVDILWKLLQKSGLHTADYTQLYDFLKYNQKKVDDLRAERLAKTHETASTQGKVPTNPFNYSQSFHQDQPSPNSLQWQQTTTQSTNNYNPQPSFNQNYMQQPMPNPEDITDPQPHNSGHYADGMELMVGNPVIDSMLGQNGLGIKMSIMSSTESRESGSSSVRVQNQGVRILEIRIGQNWCTENWNGNVVAARSEGQTKDKGLRLSQTHLLICTKGKKQESLDSKLTDFDLMAAAAADLDEI
ncbi:alpha-1,4 glucan phosphorylase L-2 isozyme, chloroplastic/amyloplastic [Tanacetum coccineum]